jgi:hypothetical protein
MLVGKTNASSGGSPLARRHALKSSVSQESNRTVRRVRVFSARTSSVRSRTSRHRNRRSSPGRSPAYASTDTIAASRVAAASRIRSTVSGASGRTSSPSGSRALRTTRCGLYGIRPPSAARCRIAPRSVIAFRIACGPTPLLNSSP